MGYQFDGGSALQDILQGYHQGADWAQQRAQKQQQMQEQLANQQEKGAEYGNENYLTPTRGPGGFVNGYSANTGALQNDVPQMKRMLPHAFPQPPSVDRQQADADAADAAESERIKQERGNRAPQSEEAYPTQTATGVLSADQLHAETGPQQGEGDPAPLARDPKISQEYAKARVAGQPHVGPSNQIQGDNHTIVGDPQAPWMPSPHMATQMGKTATAPPNVNFDPMVSTSMLPPKVAEHFQKVGVDQIPTSLAKGYLSGQYKVEAAEAGINAKSLPEGNDDLISHVESGGSLGDAVKDWSARNPGQRMPPALYRALQDSARRNLTAQGVGIRQYNSVQKALQDPVFRTYQQQIDGASNILNLLSGAKAGKYPTTKAFLAQFSDEVKKLEIGSRSAGLGDKERTELRDSAADMSSLYDYLAGSTTNVDLQGKLGPAEAMVREMQENYKQKNLENFDRFSAGAPPAQEPIWQAKRAEIERQYHPEPAVAPTHRGGGHVPKSHAPQSTGGGGDDIDKQYAEAVKTINGRSDLTPEQKQQIVGGFRTKYNSMRGNK